MNLIFYYYSKQLLKIVNVMTTNFILLLLFKRNCINYFMCLLWIFSFFFVSIFYGGLWQLWPTIITVISPISPLCGIFICKFLRFRGTAEDETHGYLVCVKVRIMPLESSGHSSDCYIAAPPGGDKPQYWKRMTAADHSTLITIIWRNFII